MIPDPLHPAVVHFPLVLAILLPFFAAGAIVAIRRGVNTRRAWLIPLALAVVLPASAFVAIRTGEAEEERVEPIISENVLHEHEEAAERFLVLSGVLLLIAATGAVRGDLGKAARLITVIGSVGVAAAGVQVGAAGGELVYKHNAASAYANPVSTTQSATPERHD